MYQFDPKKHTKEITQILERIDEAEEFDKKIYRQILQEFPKNGKGLYSKSDLVAGYEMLLDEGEIEKSLTIEKRIKMKPTRTISGVVPITVLTKPFHCPGECIFCPLEKGMPKSYLKNEPGAQRAERNKFSPYMQVYNRLLALKNIGHNTNKAELIILGGTWSYYPVSYQIWFIKEMFRALNDFDVVDTPNKQPEPKGKEARDKESLWSKLQKEHKRNETAKTRSVGLSIETRPDFLNEQEVTHLRKLGCTKIQIGIQSMNDKVLEMNKRGHKARASIDAANVLRQAGFKIQAHYMPNLYGSTPEIDIQGYKDLYSDLNVQPDELKLYPTSVIANTELFDRWKEGKYRAYDQETLMDVLVKSLIHTPEYTRLTRVIRDIPSTDIVTGNKKTNFRQMVEDKLEAMNRPCQCIRCREIKNKKFDPDKIKLNVIEYKTEVSYEKFLQYITADNHILGFLRLSIPKKPSEHFIEELKDSALIREIHVYGTSLNIEEKRKGAPQHLGLGTKLIKKARKYTIKSDCKRLSVISAIGTKEYYRKKGFEDGELYQHMEIEKYTN